ncbi:FAD/NAD(P)-binding domain-containing protein [Auriscalpium vulgare]|uniref:FAD/NAD(P)-binding domain-containing protein n=1 Tax=Auriscalpium vulgare TaxID=40419 RepID=A0ACB8RML7_9AGAM|nr:FAD/NAD(P)-binding domain-containing protein [Auriscalpium vulgare]
MSNQKVLIIGAGVAGPVLAIFLKQRGYEPIVYEKTAALTDAGVGLMLQPNGLKVLSQIRGLVRSLPGKELERLRSYSTLEEDPGLLGENLVPSSMPSEYGIGMRGIKRTELHHALVHAAEVHGITIHWGHTLVSLEQSTDTVKGTFADGSSDSGTFLVGCDGLHSATRIALFGSEPATFTGLTQTGGISRTPRAHADKPSVVNWFGKGAHMIAYPISDTHTSWAITLREEESRETWKEVNQQQVDEIKQSARASWGYGADDLIKNTEKLVKIVKFGLYDRPDLRVWHKERVVLLGDAAHPTSPHLGQGANQTFEDIYHLTRLLDEYNADRAPLTTLALGDIYEAYEKVRIPRVSALVQGARKQGESRVVQDVEDARTRNDTVREFMRSPEDVAASFRRVYGELVKLPSASE